jgi:hypothetical protein
MQLSQPSKPPQCAGDCGASGPGHSHSTSTEVCSQRWAIVTAALDRNTKLLESLLSHTIHTRPRGTASSSTPQDSESTEATTTGKKGGLEFRVRTPRRRGKDRDELQCRVSSYSDSYKIPNYDRCCRRRFAAISTHSWEEEAPMPLQSLRPRRPFLSTSILLRRRMDHPWTTFRQISLKNPWNVARGIVTYVISLWTIM